MNNSTPIKTSTLPTLPPHLDRLIDEQWTPEASAMVDRWLTYLEAEFEGVKL